MAAGKVDKAAQLAVLPVRADEDPFIVAIGGFYRRWFNLVDDLQPMLDTVAKLKGTEDEDGSRRGARSPSRTKRRPKQRSTENGVRVTFRAYFPGVNRIAASDSL